ncbi:MAG TPA: PilZ domain-containing protein [Lacipirellula sp.]
MLALSDEMELSEEGWGGLPSRAELPCEWREYAAGAGATRTKQHERRQFCRVGLRGIAIIWQDGQVHAGYTKDVSRKGIGFYSPVQLFPKAIVQLWIPGHPVLELRIRRCKRIKDLCFECGATFTADEQQSPVKIG